MKEKLFGRIIKQEYSDVRNGAILMSAEFEKVIPYVNQMLDQEFSHLDQTDKFYAAKRITASAAISVNREVGSAIVHSKNLTLCEYQQDINQALQKTDLSKVKRSFQRIQ